MEHSYTFANCLCFEKLLAMRILGAHMERLSFNEAPIFDSIDTKQGTIFIDWGRTNHILDTLLAAYRSKEFPYNTKEAIVPHAHQHLPESLELGSKEHAMFLFVSCYYMRGRVKSVTAFKGLTRLYENAPHLFDSSIAQYEPPERISVLLTEAGLGSQEHVSKQWVENATRLEKDWAGDPRNIFEGVSDYSQCLERIQNNGKKGDKAKGFVGFQEKMVSMIAYYLMDEGMIDSFEFPLPVDLHVLRVSVANEMIVFDGYDEEANLYSKETLALMRELYHRYAVDNNVSTLELCNAVWLLSQSVCGKQPGNITLEPNGSDNSEGRSTLLVPLPINPHDRTQQNAYENSCGQCPLDQTCEWNVPGKIYYVQGELRRRGKRVVIPNDRLFEIYEL